MKYRAEIDGLRAIAVIPVILFHGGFKQFSGGFVGVDIFFVISGYLITTIILSEKERSTFSLVNFYERRARRILPALFLVMSVSLPFAWFWLIPSDMKDFSQSLVAISTFSSNILFWNETGYWGVDNELKPMLHTWSLAVEEQYYILFPIFLMLISKFRKRWILSSFLILVIISLMGSQWGAKNYPTANFFLLPTRAWELAIGASISFCFLYNKQFVMAILSHRVINEVFSITGLILIGYSIFSFNETVPFPSFYALMPTIGAGLIIIFSSPKTLVGRILGTKALVGIGLISYSAYLWHQPLFAFSRHRILTEPSQLLFSTLVLISFIFGYLSWKFVEKPFRKKGVFDRRAVFIFGSICSVLFIAIGVAGHITNGFDGLLFRKNMTQHIIDDKLGANHGLSPKCNGEFTLSPECRTSDKPEILIWGDSFAMHLVPGILSSDPDLKIIQMTKNTCGPFFDVAPVTANRSIRWAESCLEFTEKVRKWITENNTVKYVVISSPFTAYLSRRNKLLTRSGNLKQANIDIATKEFNKTIKWLESIEVTPVIFSPPPRKWI